MNFMVPGCFRTVWKGRWASKRRLSRAQPQYNSVFEPNLTSFTLVAGSNFSVGHRPVGWSENFLLVLADFSSDRQPNKINQSNIFFKRSPVQCPEPNGFAQVTTRCAR